MDNDTPEQASDTHAQALDTTEIEKLLTELKSESKDLAEFNRIRLALKQTLVQAVAAAETAVADAAAAVEFAPDHLKDAYGKKQTEAVARVRALKIQLESAARRWDFKLP